jgi:hypothetical protein
MNSLSAGGGTIAHPIGLSRLCILYAAHVDVPLAQRQACRIHGDDTGAANVLYAGEEGE